MPGRKASLIAALVLVGLFTVPAQSQSRAVRRAVRRPFMLFISPLRPPQGPRLSLPFTKAVFELVKASFDTTTYQAILVDSLARVEIMSNEKKDIVVFTDTTDWHVEGPGFSTLVLWAKYRTGFLLGRIEVAYTQGELKRLPEKVAAAIAGKLRTEFLGSVALEGGPPDVSMTMLDRMALRPPCELLLPAGQHGLVTAREGFATRVDTIDVLPGRTNRKRVLLLPLE